MQWTFITLIAAAAVIMAVALAAVSVFGQYSLMLEGGPERRRCFLLGLVTGFILWPLGFLLAMRIFPQLHSWVITGPVPFDRMDRPLFLFALGAVLVGGPVTALALSLHLSNRR
ncbi:MAG: hypothetical protein R6U70_10400 [Bacillota bacterium]